MSVALHRNIGAFTVTKEALDPTDFGGSSTGINGIQVFGPFFDRLGHKRSYLSAVLGVAVKATDLTNAKTATVAIGVQDSELGTTGDVAAYSSGSVPSNLVLGTTTTSSGAPSPRGVIRQPIDLSGARRYIRAHITPTLDATSSGALDTLGYGGVFEMCLADEMPGT